MAEQAKVSLMSSVGYLVPMVERESTPKGFPLASTSTPEAEPGTYRFHGAPVLEERQEGLGSLQGADSQGPGSFTTKSVTTPGAEVAIAT